MTKHTEDLAKLGWQYFECPACGSEGARAFPKPAQQEPVAYAEQSILDWLADSARGPTAYAKTTLAKRKDGKAQIPLYTSPPAQQEPVARQYQNRDGVWKDFISEKHYKDTLEDGSWPIRNLYTSPQRTWVGLTDEEITDIWAESSPYYHEDDFARAIEAKLRSKNEDRN
jgi:hypothetical protein